MPEVKYRKKLIEVSLPLGAINNACAEEKAVPRHGHPSTLHLWWARRPLAACRAVLFAQLVDDPAAWPDHFPSEEQQRAERARLFSLIEELVAWESIDNETVLRKARLEIAHSFARAAIASGAADDSTQQVLRDGVGDEIVVQFLRQKVPPIHDPFSGGGSIPIEAARFGLRVVATDLNPVAVLLNRAQIELVTRFEGRKAETISTTEATLSDSSGLHGLSQDVRNFGVAVRERAAATLSQCYPRRALPEEMGGGHATPIAYLWARTVASPDPAYQGAHTPLCSNFLLSDRKDRAAWVELKVDKRARKWSSTVRYGSPDDRNAVEAGTKSGRGAFRCVFSGAAIDAKYLRQEGVSGRLDRRLLAVVVQRGNRRFYLAPSATDEAAAENVAPSWIPDVPLPEEALGFRVQNYGIRNQSELYLPRQLHALSTFAAAIREVGEEAEKQYLRRHKAVEDAKLYGTSIAVFLALALSKMADWNSMFCGFIYGYEKFGHTFGKQTLSVVWDFAELCPLSEAVGNWLNHVEWVADAIDRLPPNSAGHAELCDASKLKPGIGWDGPHIFATDPPYYDNIGYADLSDFFYVWLRHVIGDRLPDLFQTIVVPKADEIVAAAERFSGDRDLARAHFQQRLGAAFERIAEQSFPAAPTTIFYAFKETENRSNGKSGDSGGAVSTGWEAMLAGLLEQGFEITGTWPVRSERTGRLRDIGANALASSVVLVCRRRPTSAATISVGEFRRILRLELPTALRALQDGAIAPVDMPQASIGPGMAIFSRYARVLEANGEPMSVHTALQLINEALDESLGDQETTLDAETRFAVTWFESHQWSQAPYGEAENVARARNVSVSGIAEAGIAKSGGGKVRLLKRAELPSDWDPRKDSRRTTWEATQHLIKRLEGDGEPAAAQLLAALGPLGSAARDLAYRLYLVSFNNGWTEEALAYNGLVSAWPDLERLARHGHAPAEAPVQQSLL